MKHKLKEHRYKGRILYGSRGASDEQDFVRYELPPELVRELAPLPLAERLRRIKEILPKHGKPASKRGARQRKTG
jgi:hypothetical protein